MIPPSLYSGPFSYLWQVILHSAVAGLVFYVWSHRVHLPSGAAKRSILVIILVLPLLTAAVPGRTDLTFRDQLAWLDSGRLLAIPLVAGARLWHVALLVAVAAVALTVWQELAPALRWSRPGPHEVPESLERSVRSLPGWSRCRVALTSTDDIHLATGGWPWRPRLLVSRGAVAALAEEELLVALRHENAHWRAGRWIRSHGLFAIRLLQSHNPVALWVFREYCLEVEIECDAEAVAGRDPKLLARILLEIYEATDVRDIAARGALRKRVDVLLGRDAKPERPLPAATVLMASMFLLLVLPWLV